MTRATRHIPLLRQGLVTLLLVAVLVRALVPIGFMPGSAGDGLPLVICSAGEIRTLTPDGEGPTEPPGDETCWFVALSSLVLLGLAAAALLALFQPGARLFWPRRRQGGVAALACGPPLGARAPPC